MGLLFFVQFIKLSIEKKFKKNCPLKKYTLHLTDWLNHIVKSNG